MASRYYGNDKGSHSVSEGSSTNSTGVELVVDLAKIAKKHEVLIAMEEIKNYILKDGWKPA